jgi:hypothetical protein
MARSADALLLAFALHACDAFVAPAPGPVARASASPCTAAPCVPSLPLTAGQRAGVRARPAVAQFGDPNAGLFDPEKWTESGLKALQNVPKVCERVNQRVAEAEHLAMSILEDDKGMGTKVLDAAGASARAVRRGFEEYARKQPQVFSSGPSSNEGNLVVGSSLSSLVERAASQASQLTDKYLSAEHVLLALLEDSRCGRAVLADAAPGLTAAKMRTAIDKARGNKPITTRTPEGTCAERPTPTTDIMRPALHRWYESAGRRLTVASRGAVMMPSNASLAT